MQLASVLVRDGAGYQVFVPDTEYGEGSLLPPSRLPGETRKWVAWEPRLREMAEGAADGSRSGDIVLIFDVAENFITVNLLKELNP